MFINKKRADFSGRSIKSPASALLAALIFTLFLVLSVGPATAEPLSVSIAPNGSIKLPTGWIIMDSAELAGRINQTKESLSLPISSSTAFFAVKKNPAGEQIAAISLERAQAAPLNSNIFPLLSPEEKQELFNSVRMVVTSAFTLAKSPMEITDITTKSFGRYNTLIVSGKQSDGHNPTDFHLIYYFLPNDTYIFSVLCRSDSAKELTQDFNLIMSGFDPDKSWQPTRPPERKSGESLPDYLSRIYGVEPGKLPLSPPAPTAANEKQPDGSFKETLPANQPPAFNATKAESVQTPPLANKNATQTQGQAQPAEKTQQPPTPAPTGEHSNAQGQ